MAIQERALGLTSGPARSARRPRVPQLFGLRSDLPAAQYGAIAISSFALLLIAWAIGSYGGIISPYILPTPTAVGASAIRLLSESLPRDAGISTYRVVMGFLISAAIAIPLGLMIGVFKPVEAFVEPFVGFVRYLPAAAFIPL